MKKLLFLLLLNSCVFSFGQQKMIDSLKIIYQQTKDKSVQLITLEKLTELLKNNGDDTHEEVLYYIRMFKLSKQLNSYTNEARAAKYLASYYLRKENVIQAEKYALQSKRIALDSHDNPSLLKAYRQLGLIYNHFDEYKKAIVNYNKALNVYENILTDKERQSEKRMLGIIFSSLSTVYKNVHQDSLAVVYDLKSIDLATKTNDICAKVCFM